MVRASPAKGQPTEVQAQDIIVHGGADPATYPLQKKGHSLEFLRETGPPAAAQQHLRRRGPRPQSGLHVDPQVLPGAGLPLRPPADHHRPATAKAPARCSASPRSTSAKLPRNDKGEIDYTKDFFGRPTYLTVSGQLEAEIFACALGKVYTFGPTFRAENSNTSRHLAEFWMVEPEMAFFELTDNMDLAEAFLKRIFRDVLEQLRRGHAVLQGAHRADGDQRRWKASSTASSCACRTPRRWTSWRSRARRSSSR